MPRLAWFCLRVGACLVLQLHEEIEVERPLTRRVTLVLGGARSGKSRYGQRLAGRAARVTVIATGVAGSDEEMRRKIARHREERPAAWTTVEEPLEVARAIETAAGSAELVLVDCLTFFAANLLERFGDEDAAIEAAFEELCGALKAARGEVVLVSNEVGSGVVPEYFSGRRFRDVAGELNQRVAAIAGEVVLMVAGLPLRLKTAGQP